MVAKESARSVVKIENKVIPILLKAVKDEQ